MILLSLILLVISAQSQWLTVSPVGRVADSFYAGQLKLRYSTPADLLSLLYLLVFIAMSVPASFLLHRLGIRWVVWIAGGLIIFGSLTKALYVADLRFVLFGQLFLAIGQTLVLVSITEIVSRWFPVRERGMAVGLVSTSQYFSLALVMIVSPLLVVIRSGDPAWGKGFEEMMRFWGVFSSVFALIPAFLIRENPPTPSSHYPSTNPSYLASFRPLGLNASLRGLLIIFSIGWGVLMTLFIKIDLISDTLGIYDSNGVLGIALLGGGMVGAATLPLLSDRFRRRKLFYFLCNVASIPGFILLIFSAQIGQVIGGTTLIAIIGCAIIGLSLLAAIPIGTQYAAELGAGVGEEVIQSLLLLFSQGACALILLVTLVTRNLDSAPLLSFLGALLAASMVGSAFLKESTMIITEDERLKEAIEVEIVHLQ
jgi:MFS family permease